MNSSKGKKIISDIIFLLSSIIVLMIIYEILAYRIDSEFILPRLKSVFSAMGELLSQKAFWKSFFNTVFRTLLAFIISLTISSVMALLTLFKRPFLNKFINLLLRIIRALPTVAVTLVILLWVSFRTAPIVVSSLVIMPTLFSGIKSALDSFDTELVEMMKVYKVSKKNILKVYMREILPKIGIVISANLSLNLKLMIAGEVLSYTANSIGGMMNTAKLLFEMSQLMALTILVVITAIIIEVAMNFIIRRVTKR